MAAPGGLNCMARLPADGQSMQSRSSGSISVPPSTPLALAEEATTGATPSVENVKQGEGQKDERRQPSHTGGQVATALDNPTGNRTTAVAVVHAQEGKGGCTGDEECQEYNTSLRPVEGVNCSKNEGDTTGFRLAEVANDAICSEVARIQPQEVIPTVEGELKNTTAVYTDGVIGRNAENVGGPTTTVQANDEEAKLAGTVVEVEDVSKTELEKHLQASSTTLISNDNKPELGAAVETRRTESPLQPSDDGDDKSGLVSENTDLGMLLTESEAATGRKAAKNLGSNQELAGHEKEDEEESSIVKPSPLDHEVLTLEKDRARDSEATPEQDGVFFPSKSFTSARPGYVFKTGDKGLGFYVEGYVGQSVKGTTMLSHRPWNAGPGEGAIRRGPLGPIPKPFTKIVPFRTREEKIADEESDMRPFMARMVAQRNSRGFQSTLFEREHALDKHILNLLEKFSDPSVFKKKHGYNVHGQMLGKDGKMIVKVVPEKTEAEKAKLPWYRKVYEDRLGKHLPSKRLGDSIEARREAYAYSRHFTSELNGREDELNRALTKALKGQTKLEFITEDYHYPGAYDLHGKVILEKGAPVLNDLHRTDEQNERACTYRYKAIRRYRAAHDDIWGAISKKDKALQKVIKNTDLATLVEISEEAVTSSGMGIYRQKNRVTETSGDKAGNKSNAPTERPEQLRQKFAQNLKAEIKGKDKGLLKEIAAFDEDEAEQMIGEFSKGTEVLPNSWRQDPETLARMQRRRKELIAENTADRRKVVCPWRPGGKHIARGPWQPFTPRDHRPPVRSASEGKAEAHNSGGTTTAQEGAAGHGSVRGSGNGKTGAERRPHTAPTNSRKGFMDAISPRARRVLAAQAPGTALHSIFSTYSNDPFPLETRHRTGHQSGSARTEDSIYGYQPSHAGSRADVSFQGTQQRAWAEISCSSTRAQTKRGSGNKRPHSAVADISRKPRPPLRRPATACGTHGTARGSSGKVTEGEAVPECNTTLPTNHMEEQEYQNDEPSRDLHVRSGPGVTVLWARLCAPSSDLAYKSSAWPQAPNEARPTRRRAKTKKKPVSAAVSASDAPKAEGVHERSSPQPETESNAPADIDATQVRSEGVTRPPSRDSCPLEDLEDSLFASSSQRVKQRIRVFRGYAERSRRERTWDPGSAFYAAGATKHHIAESRPCNGGSKSGKGKGIGRASSIGGSLGRNHQRDKRRRSKGVGGVRPVDMDWEKVDVEHFEEAAKEIEEVLATKLYAVATHPGELGECFRDAQGLVESAGALLGCPENEQDGFRKKADGGIGIGNYVAAVSRLNLLWTAACGVIEIVGMIQRRQELLEIFCSEEEELSTTENASPCLEDLEDATTDLHCMRPAPAMVERSSQDRRMFKFEKRLELAEFSVAIAESVKLWMTVIPWSVNVLYGGKPVLSSLRIEEEALPWPPDPGASLDAEDGQARRNIALEGAAIPALKPQQQHCTPCDAEEEAADLEVCIP